MRDYSQHPVGTVNNLRTTLSLKSGFPLRTPLLVTDLRFLLRFVTITLRESQVTRLSTRNALTWPTHALCVAIAAFSCFYTVNSDFEGFTVTA